MYFSEEPREAMRQEFGSWAKTSAGIRIQRRLGIGHLYNN